MSIDYGESVINPFYGSSVDTTETQKIYDFEFMSSIDEDGFDIQSDDQPFDDIIDLSENLDL